MLENLELTLSSIKPEVIFSLILEVIKKVYDQILEQNQNNFRDWEITKIYLFVRE